MRPQFDSVEESPVASWEDYLGVLDAPLESLIVPAGQVHCGEIVDRWDLPPDDRAALRRWGVPKSHLALPEPQDQVEPTLVPNVAGPVERACWREISGSTGWVGGGWTIDRPPSAPSRATVASW